MGGCLRESAIVSASAEAFRTPAGVVRCALSEGAEQRINAAITFTVCARTTAHRRLTTSAPRRASAVTSPMLERTLAVDGDDGVDFHQTAAR